MVFLDSQGRITIPEEFRDKLGISPGDDLFVKLEGTQIVMRRSPINRFDEIREKSTGKDIILQR